MPAGSPLIPVLTGQSARSQRAGPFEVTLVEHAGSVALTRHRHREAVLGLLLRGTYDEWLDGRTVEPGRASLLIKPPETPHANRIGRKGTHTVLIQIQPDAIPAELAALVIRPAIHSDARICGLGERIVRELHSPSPSAAGLEALIFELFGVAEGRGGTRGAGYSRAQAWVTRAREFIHLHAAESFSLTDVAEAAGVERAHLARTFRAVFGCTVGECVRAARVERAALRLRGSEVALSRLAAELGFADQAHLTRTFRRAYRTTPAAYRRERGSNWIGTEPG